MDLYDIAVARKLSGGSGGGGGSSDFSTAEVTITITGESYIQIPTVVSTPMDAIINRQVQAVSGEVSLIVPLYKGSLGLTANVVAGESINVTGDAQVLGGSSVLITGDCTITIS